MAIEFKDKNNTSLLKVGAYKINPTYKYYEIVLADDERIIGMKFVNR